MVRNVVRESRCDIVLFQESKCNKLEISYVTRLLPSFFSYEVSYNLALNSACGIIIAWRRSFQLLNSWSTRHSVTVLLQQPNSGKKIWVTNVYGPIDDALKPVFLKELEYTAARVDQPWSLAGDFNLIRWLVDRSSNSSSFALMELFNRFISDMGIMEVPLRNRTYTWSNKRPIPVFSKLDRIFLTPDWSVAYPIITLEALEVIVSDHTPLLLTCKGLEQRKKRFQLELFWFRYTQPKLLVQKLWSPQEMQRGEPLNSFHNKISQLHTELTQWQSEAFGHMEKQLDLYKKMLLTMDQLEERRNLTPQELRLRLQVRESSFELANNIESKWKQRSRCNWISQGDQNTRFFHSFASSRLRRNMVLEIEENGQLITEKNLIQNLFVESMKAILGTSTPVLDFCPQTLYPVNPCLQNLELPFTLEEVELAVMQLANNKASGPDGIPNEFLKIYWQDIKNEVYQLVLNFYDHKLDLWQYNEANIIMVPKVESPWFTSDFRPISVLNIIPKLLAKILSNRLRVKLPDLISINQTAFVHGRQIAENFVTTREIIHHLSQTCNPVVFAKIDFRKAFDSVEWEFLIRVMKARGFPDRWIKWMRTIWETSSSRICINGELSDMFYHKRGLHQGDLLSPMLFNLVVDVFQRMIQQGNSILDTPLSNRIPDSIIALQYADDTTVISRADITSLITFKLILRLFTKVSGLQVNFGKSTFVLMNLQPNDCQWVTAVMGCTPTNFPITYLGMPLTIRAPTKDLFLPLVEKIERRLQGWQSKLLSRGGRLQLIQSVVSTIPIYHMICFKLPKWVILRIDKARRSFLWGGYCSTKQAISLCNWNLACLHRQWGGMGISDLYMRNISLLLRWWWKGYKEPLSTWTIVIKAIRWQGNYAQGPFLWCNRGSFFWIQLLSIKGIFTTFTKWVVGDGTLISFWYDRWGPQQLALTGSRQTNHAITLCQASLPEIRVKLLKIWISQCSPIDQMNWFGTGDHLVATPQLRLMHF